MTRARPSRRRNPSERVHHEPAKGVEGAGGFARQRNVDLEFLLDPLDPHLGVSGLRQIVRDVGVGPHQRDDGLVELYALRLARLQIRSNLGVAAEIVNVFQLAPRRLHRFAQQRQRFERIVQAITAQVEAILEQHIGVGAARAAIEF